MKLIFLHRLITYSIQVESVSGSSICSGSESRINFKKCKLLTERRLFSPAYHRTMKLKRCDQSVTFVLGTF